MYFIALILLIEAFCGPIAGIVRAFRRHDDEDEE